jgi:hypothetical protein
MPRDNHRISALTSINQALHGITVGSS